MKPILLDDLLRQNMTMTEINGRWVRDKPLSVFSIRDLLGRIRCAWLILCDKAIAVQYAKDHELFNCKHRTTHREPWPTGDEVEVCDKCGCNRLHWELGTTAWTYFDLAKHRQEVQASFDTVNRTSTINDTRRSTTRTPAGTRSIR